MAALAATDLPRFYEGGQWKISFPHPNRWLIVACAVFSFFNYCLVEYCFFLYTVSPTPLLGAASATTPISNNHCKQQWGVPTLHNWRFQPNLRLAACVGCCLRSQRLGVDGSGPLPPCLPCPHLPSAANFANIVVSPQPFGLPGLPWRCVQPNQRPLASTGWQQRREWLGGGGSGPFLPYPITCTQTQILRMMVSW